MQDVPRQHDQPNIILIYADDLGRGMLSCYGQRLFETSNIDRLAAEGVRFTNAYGCAFCAPARASLLTGYHDCHAGRWSFTRAGIYKSLSTAPDRYDEIRELLNSTSFTERVDEVFLATIAKRAGYVTGQIGKLEWGFATTPERLAEHGWDEHYGYYDHARCHGFYPPFLFENGTMVPIAGNEDLHCGVGHNWESPQARAMRRDRTGKAVYSQDLFGEKIRDFLRVHRDEPFFLYHPSQLPHGPIAIPEVHPAVRDLDGLTEFEKEYASMVLRLDQTVGAVLDELEALGIDDKTLVLFCSDNGHEVYYREKDRCTGCAEDLEGRHYDNVDYKYYSERSGDVFDGNDGMAGRKLSSLEGGARIPYLVRWPGQAPAGRVSDTLIANYDLLPTLAELLGQERPAWKDGESVLKALRGEVRPRRCPHVVFAGTEGPALVTEDGWKVRYLVTHRRFELFHLATDYREEKDKAAEQPERVRRLGSILLRACDGNFLHGTAENHKALRIDEYMDGLGADAPFAIHPREEWGAPEYSRA